MKDEMRRYTLEEIHLAPLGGAVDADLLIAPGLQPGDQPLHIFHRDVGQVRLRLPGFEQGEGKRRETVPVIELRGLSGQAHATVGAGHNDEHFVPAAAAGKKDTFEAIIGH